MRVLEGVGTLVQLGGLMARLCRLCVLLDLCISQPILLTVNSQELQARAFPSISRSVGLCCCISLFSAIDVLYSNTLHFARGPFKHELTASMSLSVHTT